MKLSVPAILPNENGPLCKVILSSSIREANLCVTKALQSAGKRTPYLRVSDDERVIIGKYAAECKRYDPIFPDNTLKESTVHGWKKPTSRNFASGRIMEGT